MMCPLCGSDTCFEYYAGRAQDAETGPYDYECGICENCGGRIDVDDLDLMEKSSNAG